MNEQTIKLLEQLAKKLGTTTEYLWTVLIKQAPIDSTLTLFQILLVIIFGIVLYRVHKRFLKENDNTDSRSIYDEYDEYAKYPMFILTIVFAFLIVVSIFSIESVVNGYFHPEYWALNKVLSSLSNN